MVETFLFISLGIIVSIGYYLVRNLPTKWRQRGIIVTPSPRTLGLITIGSVICGYSISSGMQEIQAAAFLITVTSFLMLLAGYIDWKTCKIPNELILLPWLCAPIVLTLSFSMESLLILLFTLVALLLAGIITNFVTRGKLGMGDIKMLLTFGLLSYYIDPMVIFYGLFISFILQLIFRYLWRKQNETTELGAPYGLALALGILSSALAFG
jgi:Flp pilus assembly protein protease CpaA